MITVSRCTLVRAAICVTILTIEVPAFAADKLREKLLPYKSIEVTNFRNKVGDVLEQSVVLELQGFVVKALNETNLISSSFNTEIQFPQKDTADDTKVAFQGTGKEEDAGKVVLFSEIITFNKGSRTRRYLLGGGSGRAELRGNCYLVDKKTGQQLYYFQTFGETNWGLMGGGADKTLKGYSNRIASFVKGKY